VSFRKISREEFVGEAPKRKDSSEAKAELAFNVFDKNHDGYITKGEMLKVSKNLTKEQVSYSTKFAYCSVSVRRRPASRVSGKRPASVRRASGGRPASVRQTSGKRPASVRRASGERPASVRRASGERPASVRRASSDRPESVRRSSGERTASIRRVSGERPASIRRSTGERLIKKKRLINYFLITG
jgi:hypothetical protein